jgi:oligoribonuclease (3'-5' exoribonuclease)
VLSRDCWRERLALEILQKSQPIQKRIRPSAGEGACAPGAFIATIKKFSPKNKSAVTGNSASQFRIKNPDNETKI